MAKKLKKAPRISVVIPLYNKELHIERCLKSVLAQTYQPIEIIVVDDGSTDSSVQMVKKINDSRIHVFQKPNGGPAAARNFGVSKANGEIIAFLDADDLWLPGFLNEIYNLTNKFPQARVFATAVYNNNGERTLPKSTDRLYKKGWNGIVDLFYLIFRGFPFNSSSIAIKRETILDFSGFKEELRYGEDIDFWIRLALQVPIAYSHKYLSEVFQNAENRSNYEEHNFDFFSLVNTLVNSAQNNRSNSSKSISDKYQRILTGITNIKYFYLLISIKTNFPTQSRWKEIVTVWKLGKFKSTVFFSPAIRLRQKIKMGIQLGWWCLASIYPRK